MDFSLAAIAGFTICCLILGFGKFILNITILFKFYFPCIVCQTELGADYSLSNLSKFFYFIFIVLYIRVAI